MRFLLCRRFRTPRAQPSASNEWAITRVVIAITFRKSFTRRKSMHTFKNPNHRWGTPEDLDALGIPREHTVTSPGFGPKSKPPQEPETKPSPAGLETPEPKSEDGKRS